MILRKLRWTAMVLTPTVLMANLAWALVFGLSGTKEDFKLQYDVTVKDHGTGRVTVDLAIADAGLLKPLTGVQLMIPNNDGTGYVDLVVSMHMREVDGKQMASVHIKRDLAERAKIQLLTSTLNGTREALTGYSYDIPIAEYLKDETKKGQ